MNKLFASIMNKRKCGLPVHASRDGERKWVEKNKYVSLEEYIYIYLFVCVSEIRICHRWRNSIKSFCFSPRWGKKKERDAFFYIFLTFFLFVSACYPSGANNYSILFFFNQEFRVSFNISRNKYKFGWKKKHWGKIDRMVKKKISEVKLGSEIIRWSGKRRSLGKWELGIECVGQRNLKMGKILMGN